jgi:hypothetical protein
MISLAELISRVVLRRVRYVECAAVSWSLFLVPAHQLAREHGSLGQFTAQLANLAAEAKRLPTVEEVLAELAASGCHGDAWYRLEGLENPLPRCPDYARCAAGNGFDLGEVSLHCGKDLAEPVHRDDLVECVSMRKPGAGALRAAIALAALGAPQIAFDNIGAEPFIAMPGQQAQDLATSWPW